MMLLAPTALYYHVGYLFSTSIRATHRDLMAISSVNFDKLAFQLDSTLLQRPRIHKEMMICVPYETQVSVWLAFLQQKPVFPKIKAFIT